MNRGLLLLSSFALFALASACAGFVELSGKTPITGTIRVPPSASCPVPTATAPGTSSTTAHPTSTTPDAKGAKK